MSFISTYTVKKNNLFTYLFQLIHCLVKIEQIELALNNLFKVFISRSNVRLTELTELETIIESLANSCFVIFKDVNLSSHFQGYFSTSSLNHFSFWQTEKLHSYTAHLFCLLRLNGNVISAWIMLTANIFFHWRKWYICVLQRLIMF